MKLLVRRPSLPTGDKPEHRKIFAVIRRLAVGEGVLSPLAGFFGAAGLIASALLPWFKLPTLGVFGGKPLPTGSVFQLPFQILCGIAGVMCFGILFRQRRTRSGLSWIALALLLVLFLFPYLVMFWDPPAALVATELQATDNHLKNEITIAIPDQMHAWKQSVSMMAMGRSLEVMKLRIPNVEYLAFANLDVVIYGFGFSNAFLNFMGWGYPLAVVAGLLLISSTYLDRDIPRFRLFRVQAGVFFLAGIATLAGATLPIFAANYRLREAKVFSAEGQYADALESYKAAARWLPTVDLNTSYDDQMGEIRYQLKDRADPVYYLYLGNSYFRMKQYAQATVEYRESLRIQPNNPIALHSLSMALTDLADVQYARGQYSDAISSWQAALRLNPMNMKALYEIQIGYFQASEFEAAKMAAREMLQIQKAYRLPSLSVIGQSYVLLSWCAYQTGDYAKSFQLYRRTVEPTLW